MSVLRVNSIIEIKTISIENQELERKLISDVEPPKAGKQRESNCQYCE